MQVPPVPKEPQYLTVAEIPAYVKARHDTKISRQTAYSWIRRGIRGIYLKTTKIKVENRLTPQLTVTTKGWTDEFVHAVKNFFSHS